MKLKLTFVNVGYGESILLRQPDAGFAMLIDAGSAEAEEYAECASGRIRTEEYLAAIGLDHIDIMVSTHIHEDHLCGMLPVARRWRPKALWQTLPPGFVASMRRLDPSIARNPSQYKFIRALNDAREWFADLEADGLLRSVCMGDVERPCPGLTVRVLAPGADRCQALADEMRRMYAIGDVPEQLRALSALDAAMNNYSLILALEFGGARVLLPGDTNCAGYGEIPAGALRADVFKIGHHGQLDGADEALLEAVRPKRVVCCASSDRRYNSAHPTLMAELRRRGAKLLFSDCPDVAGEIIPPHNALTLEIDEDGGIAERYE